MRLFKLSSQLLLSDLNKTTSNVAPYCTGVTSGHVSHIPVLRDLDAQLLSDFVFQLV